MPKRGNDDYCSQGVDGKHQRGMSGCGCSKDPEVKKRQQQAAQGGRPKGAQVPATVKGHTHNYQNKGRSYIKREGGFEYVLQDKECQNKGCPQPKFTETLATVAVTKKHEHRLGATPVKTGYSRKKFWATYQCVYEGCTYTETK